MSSGDNSRPASADADAGNNPSDSYQASLEDKDTPSAPTGDLPQPIDTADDMGDLSDDESLISELDEEQFADFNIENIAIDRPVVAVDESNVNEIGVHKRKRTAEDEQVIKKKKKEAKREKPKKARKKRDDDDNFSGGEELEGKRTRKKKDGSERKERSKRRSRTPENEDLLDPEERRRRALDRAMDEALRNPNKRRRKHGDIDINDVDTKLEKMRKAMSEAAQADADARGNNKPAMHKLKMLPEVVSMLNRNNIKESLCDPDINFLESVRYFLEPLNDGSLPAYNIQREIFAALENLPINRETLKTSGIGKVILFYTKSKQPELNIKRQAEKLLGEWSRPILNRSDDYRSKFYQQADYDQSQLTQRPKHPKIPAKETLEEARERIMRKPERNPHRAKIDTTMTSYTIVPKQNLDLQATQSVKSMGATTDRFMRRWKAKQVAGGARK